MADQVSLVTAASGAVTFYSTYAAARSAAGVGDLIQIWADLTNEQILLKDKVDIWMAPGRIIDMTDAKPTIVDNDGSYTSAVTCSIFGTGIIRNSHNTTSTWYECIKISNGSSIVSIECDSIEGLGAIGTTSVPYKGASIFITNISDNQSFTLNCKKVSNLYNAAIVFGSVSSGTNLNKISINAQRIDTGVVDDEVGISALVIKGTGTISVDEIVCLNKGTCLFHQAGTIVASILKMTTKNLNNFSSFVPTVSISDGDGTQNLTLFFDEIQNLYRGDQTAVGVKITQGRAKLIGRRIYSQQGLSMDLGSDIVSADIQCVEIISGTRGINISNSNEPIIIDANYIEGSNGNDGVIKCNNSTNLVLRNAKIKNTYSGSSSPFSRGISITNSTGGQFIEIENLIIVTGTTSNDFCIYRAGTTNIDIKNLSLIANKGKSDHITLKIGDDSNKKFIVDSLVT